MRTSAGTAPLAVRVIVAPMLPATIVVGDTGVPPVVEEPPDPPPHATAIRVDERISSLRMLVPLASAVPPGELRRSLGEAPVEAPARFRDEKVITRRVSRPTIRPG